MKYEERLLQNASDSQDAGTDPIPPKATSYNHATYALPPEITGSAYLHWLADTLDRAHREGGDTDIPEGNRKIWLSDTLAKQIAKELRQVAESGMVICD